MKCPKCKSEIPNDSLFCEQCGKKIEKEKSDIKRVDVRWCLLPAMFLSTCLVYMFHYHSVSYRQGYFDHGWIWLIPVIILFVFSIYYGIKKTVRPSFVLTMLLLFVSNLFMFVVADNHASEFQRIETHIYFSDSEVENNDRVVLLYSGFGNDGFQEAARMSEIVCDALTGRGYIVKDKYTSTDTEYYAPYRGDLALYIMVFLLVYLIYTYIAYKMKLNF